MNIKRAKEWETDCSSHGSTAMKPLTLWTLDFTCGACGGRVVINCMTFVGRLIAYARIGWLHRDCRREIAREREKGGRNG